MPNLALRLRGMLDELLIDPDKDVDSRLKDLKQVMRSSLQVTAELVVAVLSVAFKFE